MNSGTACRHPFAHGEYKLLENILTLLFLFRYLLDPRPLGDLALPGRAPGRQVLSTEYRGSQRVSRVFLIPQLV